MKSPPITLLMLFPALCLAQSEKIFRSQGYFSVAPGVATPGNTAMLHLAAGGDGILYKGLGANIEIGSLGPARELSASIGVLSLDGYYSFLRPVAGRKVVPFANGGYSLFFRGGHASGFNLGGGINYWFLERLGLRLEVRDHIMSQYSNVHFVGFRFGIAIR